MRLVTVSELAMMSPQERYELHLEREVKDLSSLPPEFLERIMATAKARAERTLDTAH